MTIALFVFAVPTLIAAVVLVGLIAPLINPQPARSNTMDKITAPWDEATIAALNASQRSGPGHPLTCGHAHHRMHQTLIAEPDGWHCPDDACDYRQDWAPAAMAQPVFLSAFPPPGTPPARFTLDGAQQVYAKPADWEVIYAELVKTRGVLREKEALLRTTEGQLGEERRRNADLTGRNVELTERLAALQHGNALQIHEAMRRVAAVDVPCGELLRDQKIEDVLTTQELL